MEVVNTIRKIRKYYNDIDLRYWLKYPIKQLLKQIKRISEKKVIKAKDTICLRMNCISTVSLFLQYDEIKTLVIYLRFRVYEFFHGPDNKKDEQAVVIKMLTEHICFLATKLNGIEKGIKKIEKKQDKSIDLIVNRNELDAEKTGTLSVEQCVLLVGRIVRKYVDLKRRDCISIGVPPETIHMLDEKTIRRYIEYWDQYQNGNKKNGRKPPRKDYSRNMSIKDYEDMIDAYELGKYTQWRIKNRIDTLTGKRPNVFNNKPFPWN